MIEQINPEFSFKAQMIRLKLFYFRHIIQRPSSLEKAINSTGKRGRKKKMMINSSNLSTYLYKKVFTSDYQKTTTVFQMAIASLSSLPKGCS